MGERQPINIENPESRAFLAEIEKRSPFAAILVKEFKNNSNSKDRELKEKAIIANSFPQESGLKKHYVLPKMVLEEIKEDEEDKVELLIYAGIFPNSEKQPKVRTDLKEADIEFIATKNGIIYNFPKRIWLKSQPDYLKWLKNFKRRIEEKSRQIKGIKNG